MIKKIDILKQREIELVGIQKMNYRKRKKMNLKYVNVILEAIKREKVDLKKYEIPSRHTLIKF
jgi:hypothetical protein